MSTIALVGLPNSGKSSLFNFITGNRQRVANFPGITVEKKMGEALINDEKHQLIDLPGVYTLDAASLDEKVTRDYIFNKAQGDQADVFVLVVDATNLKKSLYLAYQLKELAKKFVVALNMSDIAEKRGQRLDVERLSQKLGGAPVIPTIATGGEGVEKLLLAAKKLALIETQQFDAPKNYQKLIKQTDYIKQKLAQVELTLSEITVTKMKSDTLTQKLDSFFLHPIWGPALLMTILILIFQLLFSWSDPFMGLIEGGFEWLAELATSVLPAGLLQSLVVDGIIAGVGGILVFLPHIIFLFIIIYFLEDVGYLGRAAFILDYIMRKLGLPGKAVVPLLSSHACAIPGIMSARIIENRYQRLVTMMISPLTTCSARLPVYTLLIAVIIPNEKVFGILGMPGLVLFALYMFGILSAFAVAFLAKKTFAPSSPSYLMMELPPYRVPKVSSIFRGALQKGWIFVKKAGTVIFILSIIIWGLVTFPGAPENADKPQIHYSYAAKVGKTFEPLFRPLGFDWKITTALIPSFTAREVLVSAMGTVYAVDGEDPEADGYVSNLSKIMSSQYSLGTLMALLIWFVFSPQCIATFGVMKKETGGYKLPLLFGFYSLAMAYGFSFLAYLIFS